MKQLVPTVLLLALALPAAGSPAWASDHADPLTLKTLEPGLAGLFVFPKADRLVVILTTRRGLTSAGEYDLEPWEYTIYIDLGRFVSFEDEEDRFRYGGSIHEPEIIDPDAWITFRLDDDATTAEGYPTFRGLADPRRIEVETGVFDDPFIFPRFFEKNVIAMALSIPLAAFPEGQRDWLFWATSKRVSDGRQVDHVGRANRTQLGRLDFLNTLPPSRHVPAIEKKIAHGQKKQRFLMGAMRFFLPVGGISGLFRYVFEVREYDAFPDVMIYTDRYDPGFPNGRRLEDDIAALTCDYGDCVLQEVAWIEGGYPREVRNDKSFGDAFPYLAEPWPAKAEARHGTSAQIVEYLKLIPLALVVLLLWWFLAWRRKRIASWEPEVNE